MKAKSSSASRRSQKNLVHRNQAQPPSTQMPVIHPHAAGIDVGATSHWVCVPEDAVAEGQGVGIPQRDTQVESGWRFAFHA